MAAFYIILHILSPAVILTCFLSKSLWETVSAKEDQAPTYGTIDPSVLSHTQTPLPPKKATHLTRPQILQHGVQILLSSLVGLLYIGEAIALGCSSIPARQAGTSDEGIVFALFSSLIWLILSLSLFDVGGAPKGCSFKTTWILATAFEIILLCDGFVTSNEYSSYVRVAQVLLQSMRIIIELVLIASEYLRHLSHELASDEEIAPLLADNTTDADRKTDADREHSDETDDLDLRQVSKNWWLYVRGFKLFLPIIRPKTIRQYLCIFGVCLCIAIERIVNVAVPVTLGAIVSALSRSKVNLSMPWIPISLYIGLMILESSAGIELVRDLLWQPFEQVATQNMKRASYDKLMSLSCDFHDSKKSDVTFQTVERGTRITDLVETILFDLLPMAADLLISISVFWYLFDGYVGFVVGLVVVLYLWSIMKSLSVRSALWREFIEVWEKEWYSMTESVKNWDAVSHFSRIPYEMETFKERSNDTRQMQMRWLILSKITGSLRSLILIGGLAAGTCIVAHQVVVGGHDVGKFIIFTSYWAQLSNPLHFFARGFNSVSKGLVDAEKLLTLFEKQPTIQNAEEAVPFVFKDGAVDFENVSFSYDGKRTVTNKVTLHAEPGKIIAFVGETGCGKSTLFKLLFRFYDPKEGSILIDGQDIKNLALDSFRDHLGIVPQEPVLFNKSIRENLRYPDLEATDEQIESACKAVSLHEKITSFTKGYNEVIGERGTKLSGGERQRVAIARAILKNPSILLLDEATSSVDSNTEAQIQASLKALCANRTTFVIAHRLSTIVNADQVIVMDDGKIVESGTHASLTKQNGPYKKLWTNQLSGHLSELPGRLKSRFKYRKEKHLLQNDLHSSDDDAKKLPAEDIEEKGCTVTTDQLNASQEATSHEISHDNHGYHGRNTMRSPHTASQLPFVASKSPVRPPLQTKSSTASNFHSSHLFGAVSQNTSSDQEKRKHSIVNATDLERVTANLDDEDYVKKMYDHNSAASAGAFEPSSRENKFRRLPNLQYSITSTYTEAYKGSPAITQPTTVEKSRKTSNERANHIDSKLEDCSKTPHSPAEASRRRNQSAGKPVHQAPTQNDGVLDDELTISTGVNTKR